MATGEACCFVAVHCGAGYHSSRKQDVYYDVMRKACMAAARALSSGRPAAEAVTEAIAVLEDSSCTNAGRGSNLTESGVVECDASLMAGDGTFGAVGAVPGVRHPIQAAAKLAASSRLPMALGRVRPQFLAGAGARKWAAAQGLQVAATEEEAHQMHVTPQAHQAWQRYTAMLAASEASRNPGHAAPARSAATPAAASPGPPNANAATTAPAATTAAPNGIATPHGPPSPSLPDAAQQQGTCSSSRAAEAAEQQQQQQQQPPQTLKRRRQQQPGDGTAGGCVGGRADAPDPGGGSAEGGESPPSSSNGWPGDVADTVGCICVDSYGRVAAGVSSGGIAMKAEGRVGEAAVYGCGCWAADGDPARGTPAFAASVTGVGERIMTALLAQRLAQAACSPEQSAASSGGGFLHEQCADALRRLILPQPAPWDCGVIAARATAEPAGTEHASVEGGSAGGSGCAPGGGPVRVEVELAVAFTAHSIATAHYCPATMRAPANAIHRHPAGRSTAASSGPPTVAVVGHAVSWQLPAPQGGPLHVSRG